MSSGTGNGANIAVRAVLGDGESVAASAVTYGKILELKLVAGGSGYTTQAQGGAYYGGSSGGGGFSSFGDGWGSYGGGSSPSIASDLGSFYG